MELMNVGETLKKHWLSRDVPINPGVSEATLHDFESKYGVSLPADLRDYFLCVNGMPAGRTDEALIRFWMLDEAKPLPEGAPAYANPTYIQNPSSFFLFADFCIWSHAYAIRLSAVPSQSNTVIVVGDTSPVLLFDSFAELVDSYLTNKELLLP